MIGGVTRRMSLHLSGVPHLHVNRPLELRLIYKNAPKFVANLFRRKFLDLWNDSSNSSIPTTVLDFTRNDYVFLNPWKPVAVGAGNAALRAEENRLLRVPKDNHIFEYPWNLV